jgi:hypothetical protein
MNTGLLNMKMFFSIFLLLLLCFGTAISQEMNDARSLALAGSNIAVMKGTEVAGGNPAVLALRNDFKMEIHLLSAHLMVKNNSYSLHEYDKYFTTGDSLTSRDIDDLLGQIPESGLRGDAGVGVKAFSLYAYPFSVSLYGIGNSFANLPKSPLQLPFYGNKEIKEYRFDDLDGEGWAAGVLNFGIGLPVTQYFSETFEFASVGLAAKYIRGIQYGRLRNADGILLTTDEEILASGHLEALHSEGGSGYGIDLGFMAKYQEKWTFSLGFNNLLGKINWNKDNETWVFDFKDTLRSNDFDSLETDEVDTTYSTGNFSTGLPRSLNLAAAYRARHNLLLTFAYRQGLNKSLINTTTPRISVGAEFQPISQIPLRAGIGIGGRDGFVLGLGTGIDLKYWQLNIAYLNHNFHWFRGTRSIDLALTTQFRF